MRFQPFCRHIAPVAVPAIATLVTIGAAHAADDRELWFVDAAAASGISFVHATGATGLHHLPETMGSGVAWLDYDNDGRQDLYFVQSGPVPGVAPTPAAPRPSNRLYRNLGAGRFAAVPGVAADAGFGMAVAVADYDNDGWSDLFVSNLGANALYRNNGDGTFSRQHALGGEDHWSASAAWGDLDHDGFADLFVTNYIVYDASTATACGNPAGGTAYCHIDLFDGVADVLWRNDGDGTFSDITVAAGVANALEGKGLGVVMGDFDADGRTDVYVANDTRQNFLYLNRGDLRFEDQGLFSGTGYSEAGKSQAGMGTEAADVDGDGISEILVTNFAFESNNLYRQIAPGMFLDETTLLGFGEPGFANLAFGLAAFDADGDGDREIAVANGHILDTIDPTAGGTSYEQRNHLFRNDLVQQRQATLRRGQIDAAASAWRPNSDLFEEISEAAGPGFAPIEVSRGLAAGDANGDGRPDLAINNSGGAAQLLLNRSETANRRLVVRVRGRETTRDALGAVVRVTPLGDPTDGATGFPQHAEVRSTSSYGSQGTSDLMFGLGASDNATLEVRWPNGTTLRVDDVAADQLLVVREGSTRALMWPLDTGR